MKLKPKAIKLLERVKRHILEEPKRVDMGNWARHVTADEEGPACNTVGCIAGWTVLLNEPRRRWRYWISQQHWYEIEDKAIKLLGISQRSANHLFDPKGIVGPSGTPEHAANVAKRIDRFIRRHR